MKSGRMARVNRMIQTTLADMVPSLIRDHRVRDVSLVSVVAVKTTPDLRFAKVYLSILADPGERDAALEGIRSARGFLRGELGRRIRLKRTPELTFTLDQSQEEAARIDKVLREIAAEAPAMAPMDQVAAAIMGGERILVTSHPSPDGDAIGCMAAASLVLERLGKEVVAFNPDPVPDRFKFLAGTAAFTREAPVGGAPFDVTLVLDTSDDRMFREVEGPLALGEVVVIDHHKTPGNMGDVIHRDPSAGAVGVLLFKLFQEMGVELTLDVAEGLFCSLMSDTGSFRYQNTDPEVMRTAAAILAAGVDPWRVSSSLYEERQRCELDLLTVTLQTLRVSDDGLAAALVVTEQMLAETGCTPDMIDGLINYARGIKGVEVALLLRPTPGAVRISMRSRGTVDVSQIAQRLGGGGHHNAAGCSAEGSPDQLTERLFAEVSKLCEG